jgi:hypothetical protein
MRKFTIKSYKFCFVSRGPGETGQARALAKFLSKRGGRILFCLHQERNLFFLKDDKEFKIFLTPTPKDLKKIVEKERPEFLFLFNSKMWDENFKRKCPFKKPEFVFCFDSNWLFNSEKYPQFEFVKWADKYFILFPEKIFNLGLKEFGGNFEIEKEMKEELIPLGFIPSYLPQKKEKKEKMRKDLGIEKGEKLIFSYFSGFGAGYRSWALENFVKVMNSLIKKGRKIKAVYIGPRIGIQKEWLIEKEGVSAKKYFEILSSSDLVFMHQGMVTLAQAISCQIPVICNVSILRTELPYLHFWEVLPFKRAGVCEMFSKTTKIEKIEKRIEELLYEKKEIQKMKRKQKEIFEKGEERFLKELEKICAN